MVPISPTFLMKRWELSVTQLCYVDKLHHTSYNSKFCKLKHNLYFPNCPPVFIIVNTSLFMHNYKRLWCNTFTLYKVIKRFLSMATKIAILIFLSLFFLKGKSKDNFVHPTTCTSNNTCHTLSDYVNDANQFFTSDTAFVFLEGTHHLNNTLTLCNLYNITFQGSGKSKIVLSAGSNILCTNSSKVFFKSLKMLHSGQVNTGSDKSALHFNDSYSVILVDISFFRTFHDNFSSRAVRINNSIVQFTNCSFKNGFSNEGGALYITWSSVSFNGHNYFNNNTAQFNGGAICGNHSNIFLSGQNIYNKNAAINSSGAAIFVENGTNITFSGSNKFLNNEGSSYIKNTSIKGGGAISISYYSTIVVLDVALFINNSAIYGGAILLLQESVCQVCGQIKFINNSAVLLGGGVFLYTSSMIISGTVSFIGNKAKRGGGISCLIFNPGGSKPIAMELQEPLNMTFYGNTAKENGSAIYIQDYLDTYLCPVLAAYKSQFPCFIKIKNTTKSFSQMNLNFIENSATGSVLFGGAIEYCSAYESNISSLTGYEVLQNLSNSNFKIKENYASTPALKIRLCENNNVGLIQTSYTSITVPRGQLFNLSVIALGEFDMPIPERIDFTLTSYDDKYSTEIHNIPYNYHYNKGC